ncbi:hypothetical protein H0H81_001216 [Sphagnurus paluster]|uniref:Uncharacterized protein n=1 Tax=Sphagnurus paluster TaxID=117069 RepID=A0A9P7FZR0_9AGAR|nr:hypothetical protein H0H81_001216 [Sphagnurus paluster]
MQSRITLDIPEEEPLESLSTPALVDLAKVAVRGPRSWDSGSTTTIKRQYHIHIPDLAEGAGHHKHRNVKLVAGGQYLLSLGFNTLSCWSVAKDRKIWEYTFPDGYSSDTGEHVFGEEVVNGGDALILMVCLNSSTLEVQRHIKFIKCSREAESPYQLGEPITSIWDSILLRIWDYGSIAQFWRSGATITMESGPEPILQRKITVPSNYPPELTVLSACAHPFHDDIYRVWVYLSSMLSPPYTGSIMSIGESIGISYEIALNQRSPLLAVLSQRSEAKAARSFRLYSPSVSFSGHLVAHPRYLEWYEILRELILPLHHLESWLTYLGLEDAEEVAKACQVSEYSGALVSHRPGEDTISVTYYV